MLRATALHGGRWGKHGTATGPMITTALQQDMWQQGLRQLNMLRRPPMILNRVIACTDGVSEGCVPTGRSPALIASARELCSRRRSGFPLDAFRMRRRSSPELVCSWAWLSRSRSPRCPWYRWGKLAESTEAAEGPRRMRWYCGAIRRSCCECRLPSPWSACPWQGSSLWQGG
jgi:hypothetical protein